MSQNYILLKDFIKEMLFLETVLGCVFLSYTQWWTAIIKNGSVKVMRSFAFLIFETWIDQIASERENSEATNWF
jgi:hypothetical protein